jgi:acetoin utilization deacetylase AcuC-like enzyme
MTTLLMAAAQDSCGGRLVACHEGGYAPYYVPWCALAVVETFAGIRTSCKDPSLDYLVGRPGQELQPHQAEVIRKAASAASDIPRA